jgi:SAM-dependent methyltransferase
MRSSAGNTQACSNRLFREGNTMNETPNTSTAEVFDAMIGAYETWAEPLTARLAQVALEKAPLKAGDSVLDVGAGTGALSLQAAALGARVTAIDLSTAMVARLTQRLAPYPECKALVMATNHTFNPYMPIARWVRFHIVRTLFSLPGLACYILACLVGR